jgi:hypothetical protein
MSDPMNSGARQRPHWTVDRRVPLALVLAILFQTVALVSIGSWYLSELNGRVTVVEEKVISSIERVAIVEERQYEADKGAARLDERLKAFDRQLSRFEGILNRLTEPPR